ncbi:axotactin-like [Diadema antillarum]|uniref:axotactin-like n=1 Tax=Diadema antillarum TaxID=105358 RepID=UPI003A8BDFDF
MTSPHYQSQVRSHLITQESLLMGKFLGEKMTISRTSLISFLLRGLCLRPVSVSARFCLDAASRGLSAFDESSLPRSFDRMMGCISNVQFRWTVEAPQSNGSAQNPAPIANTAAPPTQAPGASTASQTSPASSPLSTPAPEESTAAAAPASRGDGTATAASATDGSGSPATGGAGEASSTPAPGEIPISYRVMVEDGCINGCDFSNPCIHGDCVNHYASLSCDCFMSGYEGPTCNKEGATPLTLSGFQYLTHALYLGEMDSYHARNLVSMKFKINPSHRAAVLYYANGALPIQTYLAVFMKEGLLTVNIKYSNADILEFEDIGVANDNRWHFISVEQNERVVTVTMDNTTSSRTLQGSNIAFTFRPTSHIGGGDDLSGYPGLLTDTNFVGCLKEVYINRRDIITALQGDPATSRVMFHGGEPVYECQDIGIVPVTFPTPDSYIHLEGWYDADLSVRFSFRTANLSSHMMTAHCHMNETHQGRLTLDMMNGSLHMRLATDPHVALNLDYVCSIGSRLHDGLWHTVNISLADGLGYLELDGESTSFSFSEILKPRGAVYLGGWNGKGFEGCMQEIFMQGEVFRPTEVYGTLLMRGVTLNGCPIPGNPCVAGDVVCSNGGTCIEQDGKPVCQCTDPKYTGARCQFYTYKSSCAEYFYSGDTRSGAKLIDLDGIGPFEPFYIDCDFSKGTAGFSVAHNFQEETLVRDLKLPHIKFDVKYQFMTRPMLHFLVDRSKDCHQHFNYHCFEAPLRIGKDTDLTSVSGQNVTKAAMPFTGDCDRGQKRWRRDSGNINSMFYLPITKMSFKPWASKKAQFTKATLSLGPLHCGNSLGYTYPYTVSLLDRAQHLALGGWLHGAFSFSFRTRDINALLFHQRATWRHPNFLMAIITAPNTLSFEFHMNGNVQTTTLEVSRPLTDGQWHTLTLQKTEYEIYATIDFDSVSLTLPIGEKMGMFQGTMQIGGSGILPSGVTGMSGCIAGVLLNGEYQFIYDFYNEFTNPKMKPGCSSACDKQPCRNGGQCLDEWGTFTCNCPHPALLGNDCSNDKRLDTLSFQKDSAFVNFDPSDRAVLTADFHLGFRTFQTDALLFYAHDQFGNFIQLDLKESAQVVMTFNDGREMMELVTAINGTALNSGSWVDISVIRADGGITLVVNTDHSSTYPTNVTLLTASDGRPFTGVAATVRPVLPFDGPSESFVKVYVGGVPEGTTTVPTLQGCIRGLVVDGQGWNLRERADPEAGISATCVDNCLPRNPCQNGGTCMEMWDHFKCNCSTTSYTGSTCTEDIGATFNAGSLLLYPLFSPSDQANDVLENDELHFGFSTTASSGTIFYVRNDFANSDQQNYISVSLMSGHLKFVFNFGAEKVELQKSGPFNDGFRHIVVMKRFGRVILVDVDNQGDDYKALLTAPRHFAGRAAIVVGGVEHNMTMFSEGGYKGCITSLYYNRMTPLDLDISGLGMTRSGCAAFEPTTTTAAMTTEMPSNPLFQKPMTMPPWNVQPAEWQEVPEELSDKQERDPLLMGIIIAVFVVAFLILIICIVVTAMSIKSSNNQQQRAAAGDKDGEPKEVDVLLEDGRGGSSGRSSSGAHPSPGKRAPSAEISVRELEWDPQIEKNMRPPELEWDNTSYTSPDTPLEVTPLGSTSLGATPLGTTPEGPSLVPSEAPSPAPSTPHTPIRASPSPTLLQLAANHNPRLADVPFIDGHPPYSSGITHPFHIKDTPV